MKSFLILPFLLLLFAGCQNAANKEQVINLSDSTSVTGLTGNAVKLVKSAGIQFKVSNVEQGMQAVSLLAQQHGGRVYDQQFQAVENSRQELKVSPDSLLVFSTTMPQADITVRVPSQNLEAFLFAVARIGYYTENSRLSLDDKSLTYLQNALKQKARTMLLTKPAAARPTVAANSQAIALKDEAIENFIANKTIDADAAYSTVTLRLFQNAVVRKETIANYVVADYTLPFGTRLQNAFSNGWQAFLNFLLSLLHLWMFILFGLLAFVVYKHHQSKRKMITAARS